MKRLILFLLIVLLNTGFAQGVVDGSNSTSTVLAGGATYTGTVKLLQETFASIVIQPYSNVGSATGGVQIWFSNKKNGTNNYYWDRKLILGTYTAGDTITSYTIPVLGAYYKVVYINGASVQTTFRLNTYLSKEYVPLVNQTGKLVVDNDSLKVNGDDANSFLSTIRNNGLTHTTRFDSLYAEFLRELGFSATIRNNGLTHTTRLDSLIAETLRQLGFSAELRNNSLTQITRLDTTNARLSLALYLYQALRVLSDTSNARSTQNLGFISQVRNELLTTITRLDTNVAKLALHSGFLSTIRNSGLTQITRADTSNARETLLLYLAQAIRVLNDTANQKSQLNLGFASTIRNSGLTHTTRLDSIYNEFLREISFSSQLRNNSLTSITREDSILARQSLQLYLLQLIRAKVEGTIAVTKSGTWSDSTNLWILKEIEDAVDALEGYLNDVETKLDTANAKSALNNTLTQYIRAAVEILDNAISGNEMQVDIVTSALPSGASTSANQTSELAKSDSLKLRLDNQQAWAADDISTSLTAGTWTQLASQSTASFTIFNPPNNVGNVYVAHSSSPTAYKIIYPGGSYCDDGKLRNTDKVYLNTNLTGTLAITNRLKR